MPAPDFPTKTAVRRAHEDPPEAEPDFPVSKSPDFSDGGCDFNLDADTEIKRWKIQYTGLTLAQVTALSDHAKAAKYNRQNGSAYGFNFTDRNGATHANVRYAPGGFRRSHTTYRANGFLAEVNLVKYP